MNYNFIYIINQIKNEIITYDREVSEQVKTLTNIIAVLNYSKRKINALITNFEGKSLDEKNEVLLDVSDSCKVDYNKEDAYILNKSCWSRASEEEKQEGINLFKRFIDDLDKRITMTQNKIEVVNVEFKYKRLLSFFDETTGEMIKPIEDRDVYYLLSEYLLEHEEFEDKSSILSNIALENLRLLKARDEKLLEIKKKEMLLKRRKQTEKQQVKQATVTPEKEDLTEEQKTILEAVRVILSDNSDFFNNVPSEVSTGFEMIKEENAHYYELADNNTNKGIALLDLNDLVNQIRDNKDSKLFDILKSSILEYREISNKISQQNQIREKIDAYIADQEIDINRIRHLSNRFISMDENLKEGDRNLLISIGNYLSSNISEAEKIESINQTCAGSEINLSFYKKYKLLESIYDIYTDYELYTNVDNNIDSFDEIKKIIDKMESLLNSYEEYITQEKLLDYKTANGSTSSIETPNDILYLTLDDSKFGFVTGIESYIRRDSNSPYMHKLSTIKDQIETLSISDFEDIRFDSQQCKGAKILGADESKIRKTKVSDYRVCYANINSFKAFTWPSDKQCYLVLFAGYKRGQNDFYDYASSKALENATIKFLKIIQSRIDFINSQKISDEEKKVLLDKYRIELLQQNHDLYNKSMESLASDFEPEMLTVGVMKEEGGLKNA